MIWIGCAVLPSPILTQTHRVVNVDPFLGLRAHKLAADEELGVGLCYG